MADDQRPYYGVDPKEMEAELATLKQRRSGLKEELNTVNGWIAHIEKELDRRALDTWYQAHPELLRVNVGDKLIVTESLRELKQRRANQAYLYPLGLECEVDYVKIYDGEFDGAITSKVDSWSTGLDDAQVFSDMRRAYLAAHPESEATNDRQS